MHDVPDLPDAAVSEVPEAAVSARVGGLVWAGMRLRTPAAAVVVDLGALLRIAGVGLAATAAAGSCASGGLNEAGGSHGIRTHQGRHGA